MAEYKISLGVKVNTDDISAQIKKYSNNNLCKIKIDIDKKHIDNQLNSIRKQIKQLGNIKINLDSTGTGISGGSTRISSGQNATQDTVNKLKKSYRELLTMAKQISNLEFKIGGLEIAGGNKNQIEVLKNQLKSLRVEYDRLSDSFNNSGGLNTNIFDAGDFQKLNNAITENEAKIERLKAELADDIKIKINTDIAKNISKVSSDFEKLSNKSKELKDKIQSLKDIKIGLDTAAANNDIEKLISLNEEYQRVLKEVKAQIDINKRAENDDFDSDSLDLGKEKALLRLQNLFEENSQAARKFASEVDRIQKEINECGSTKGLSNINKDIDILNSKIKKSNAQTQTLGSKLKDQFSKYAQYLSVASVFMYAEQALTSMFQQVVAIDSAMTELKKVTDETGATYDKFLSNVASRASEIGTTIDGLVSSTADFARLGYNFADSQGLAEVANIYAVVGDEVEGVEGATESLISTMAAFKDEASGISNTDFATSIIDKFNEIGNKFSITSGGIGEAMKRSASSLDAANNTIDESIALITAAM